MTTTITITITTTVTITITITTTATITDLLLLLLLLSLLRGSPREEVVDQLAAVGRGAQGCLLAPALLLILYHGILC